MSNKLLLADDSITIQKVVGIIFANEDYELTVVDNGDAALEKAKQIIPDIILVDALMPGKTGYEVCAEVRRDARLKAIPLLLLTGAFEPFDEDKARQSGADDFISKPFESQQLIDRVQKLIDLGRTRSAPTVAVEAPIVEAPQAVPVTGVQTPQSVAAEAGTAPLATDLAQAFAGVTLAEEQEDVFSLGEEVIEGSIDDDLWGAFEIEDVSGGAAMEFGAVAEPIPASTASQVTEIDDAFSFADMDDDIVTEIAEAPVEKAQQIGTGWEPVNEQTFSFDDEIKTDVSEQSPAMDAASTFSEFEFAPETEETGPEMDQFLEDPASPTEDLAFPFIEPAADVHFAPEMQAAVAPPGSAVTSEQPASLSEAQIREILSSLSREMIERIVWEVVPDLAEVLIKEEIKKLKSGAGN